MLGILKYLAAIIRLEPRVQVGAVSGSIDPRKPETERLRSVVDSIGGRIGCKPVLAT